MVSLRFFLSTGTGSVFTNNTHSRWCNIHSSLGDGLRYPCTCKCAQNKRASREAEPPGITFCFFSFSKSNWANIFEACMTHACITRVVVSPLVSNNDVIEMCSWRHVPVVPLLRYVVFNKLYRLFWLRQKWKNYNISFSCLGTVLVFLMKCTRAWLHHRHASVSRRHVVNVELRFVQTCMAWISWKGNE